MQKYRILAKLGSGAFGSVEKAENKETKEIVAIKKLKKKYSTWDECLQLPQVKALRKLVHPNIIKLKELIRHTTDAYFIFEYIDRDLYKVMQSLKQKGKVMPEADIRNIAFQTAQALFYIHKQGFFHRDLKPQNLLISHDNTVKLIDFGLAKEIRSKPPFTQYVSTRWYRAPELLLKSSTYSAPIDVFAFGCVLAELYLGKPLFMGNSEIDQINKICSLMGTPSNTDWAEGLKLASICGYNLPQYSQVPLSSVITNCSSEALNLIGQCLKWDPIKRITMSQTINHPYFKGMKFQPKEQKQPQKMGLFDKLPDKKVQSPPKTSQISDQDFDDILNGLSKKVQEKQEKRYNDEPEITSYSPIESTMGRLKLVEPISLNQNKLKEPISYSPAKETFARSKFEPESTDTYGDYLPSFGASTKDQNVMRKPKGSLGLFGLETMNKR